MASSNFWRDVDTRLKKMFRMVPEKSFAKFLVVTVDDLLQAPANREKQLVLHLLHFLEELQNCNQNYFCAWHKNWQKHYQQFELLFWTIYLHFGSSFLEIQRRLIETKPNCNSFYSVWKKNDSETFKNKVTAKNVFSSVHLASAAFLIPCDNWKILAFIKVYSDHETFFKHVILSLFRILFIISTILIPILKYKANTKVPRWSSHITHF